MTVTITADNGGGSTTPLTVLSPYAVAWTSRNVVHDLISGGIGVSLVASRPRSGEFQALYESESDAWAAAEMHRAATSFTLADDETPNIGMTYVVDGDVRLELDQDSLVLWTVTVQFQEVE